METLRHAIFSRLLLFPPAQNQMFPFRTRVLKTFSLFLISNFRRVLNVVCFLLSNSPASEFYIPTFRNTLYVPTSQAGRYKDGTYRGVPKCRHIKFRRRGITQKKAHTFQRMLYPNAKDLVSRSHKVVRIMVLCSVLGYSSTISSVASDTVLGF